MTGPPNLAETIIALADAIDRREPLRVLEATTHHMAGLALTATRYRDLPAVVRHDMENRTSGRHLRTWSSPLLAGHSFRTAGDLLAAMRFAVDHPHAPPPGAMTPAELDTEAPAPPRRQRHSELEF